MEVSRLTFRKETKEKMEKGISHFKKGELRWQKLHELEDTGRLSVAKNRQDVTRMLGLGTGYRGPYTWLSNMISRGCIKETLTGFDKNNKPEYEYHLTSDNLPNYERFGKSNIPKDTVQNPKTEPVVAKEPTPVYVEPSKMKATIRYGELVIELEGISNSFVESIIEKLIKR